MKINFAKMLKYIARICFMLYTASCLCQNGTPTTGTITMNTCCRLGGLPYNLVQFSNFSSPTLPAGATITGIYPVEIMNEIWDGVTDVESRYGPLSGHNISPSNSMYTNGVCCSSPLGTTFSNTVLANSTSIGTSLSLLSGYAIEAYLDQSFCITCTGKTDALNFVNVGFAVYYTAPHPIISTYMPAPSGIPLPAGTGIAWAIPSTVYTTVGILGSGPTGIAVGTVGSPPLLGTTTLTGTVQIPNETNFNGTLTIKINKSGVKNICVAPYLTVPTTLVSYPIVNGVPVGLSNGQFATTDCLSPRIPYYAQILDTTGSVRGSDNWYLPSTNTASIDIGSMQEQNFGGPINVAIPTAIVSTPQSSQTITQPSGTSLTIAGTVNLTGTVNFTNPLSFSLLNATQILGNGVSSSSYPLDINGIINASAGFCVAHCSTSSVGNVLIYNGTAYVPGNVTVNYPNLYNQTVAINGTAAPQRQTINFSSSFAATDSISPSQTNIGLTPVGTAGTYTNVSTIQLNAFGQVLSISGSGSGYAPGTITFSGFTAVYASSYTYSTTYSSSLPNTVVIACSAQSPLPQDVKPDCYANGSTVYVQLTNTAGNSSGNVYVPANTINFRVLP